MTLRQLKKCPRFSVLNLILLLFVGWGSLFTPDAHSHMKMPSINGFLTLEYEVSNKDTFGKYGTLDLHHFNIISKYHVSNKSIVFGEIEWEHGPDFGGQETVGAIALERGWFQYFLSEKFKLRAGKFLTPFGNYNLIHDASPAYTTSILPSSLYGKHGSKGRLYAKFSLGVMILGALSNDRWVSEYSLFLTNGRGSDPYKKDDNSNKGIGASFLIADAGRKIQFSATAYRDRNNTEGLNTREAAYTGSLKLQLDHLKVESEGALFRLETGTNTGAYINKLGGYLQWEYAIQGKFTPVARLDLFNPDDNSGDDLEREYTVGINLAVGVKTFLKSEVHFYEFDDNMQDSYRLFMSSLAVAF